MGSYLNSKKASLLYEETVQTTYFVDKTKMLDELIPLISNESPAFIATDTTK